MSECPYCGTAMESGSIAQQPYEACPGCGGVWIGADELGALVKRHPERLAELDDSWPDHGGKPSLDRLGVICPETGDELVKKAFPAAPQQPILASPKARKLFFKSGELRTLHGTVSPTTLPPPPRPTAPVDEREVREQRRQEAEAELTATAWREALSVKWPERGEGQSWPSWFVCGMPLWVAAVLLLLPAISGTILLGVVNREIAAQASQMQADVFQEAGEDLSEEDLAEMAELAEFTERDVIPAWAAFPLTYLAWPMITLGLTVVLMIVWAVGEGAPPLSVGHIFLLLLKLQAVLFCAETLVSLLWLAGVPFLLLFVLRFVLRVVVYFKVLELEFYEVLILSFVGGFLPGSVTTL